MELYNKRACELTELIRKKDISCVEVVQSFLNRIKEKDGNIGAFLYLDEEESVKEAKKIQESINKGNELGKLAGIPIGIKDNISVKNMQTSCASKILEGYKSPYDATVIENIRKESGIIIGKTNMDEFGLGSSNENSSLKSVKNPWNLNKVSGGSSGGSAAAVSSMEVPLSIGTETGGSVRQPASFCGVVGIKPTYGRVSRYGVVSFGSSLDQVGAFGKDVRDCALLTEVISGVDSKDSTSVNIPKKNYSENLNKDLRGIKIGVPKEVFNDLDSTVRNSFEESIKVLKENGAEIRYCSLSLNEYALATYYIISSAEVSSNLSRFDGVRFGRKSENYSNLEELYVNSRTEGFGKEVKRRVMLGTYVLSKGYKDEYYRKALKVRTLIKREFENIFKEVHTIILPTTSGVAFNLGEKRNNPMSMYLSDIYTVPANLAGIPAISVPCGFINGLPIGIQFLSNYFNEEMLFNLAYSYEQSTKWHNINPQL